MPGIWLAKWKAFGAHLVGKKSWVSPCPPANHFDGARCHQIDTLSLRVRKLAGLR
jgi:hypothetical protein